jgi:hypothetical protein
VLLVLGATSLGCSLLYPFDFSVAPKTDAAVDAAPPDTPNTIDSKEPDAATEDTTHDEDGPGEDSPREDGSEGDAACPDGTTLCGKDCVDLQMDLVHCGRCDHGCGGDACIAGRCSPGCGGVGQGCCPESRCSVGFTCASAPMPRCIRCGTRGQPCCDDRALGRTFCDRNLHCNDGTCLP